MTIGQVSQKYDISPDTLRYYERIGLIPDVPRNASGIRDYDEASCGWIELMKCMRSAGVEIEMLRQYVALYRQGDETLEQRRQLLICQRERLQARLDTMQNSIRRLDVKISNYDNTIAKKERQLKQAEEKNRNT